MGEVRVQVQVQRSTFKRLDLEISGIPRAGMRNNRGPGWNIVQISIEPRLLGYYRDCISIVSVKFYLVDVYLSHYYTFDRCSTRRIIIDGVCIYRS